MAIQSIRRLLMAPKLQSIDLDALVFSGAQLNALFHDLSFSPTSLKIDSWDNEGIDVQTAVTLAKAKSLTELHVFSIMPADTNEAISILSTLPHLQTLSIHNYDQHQPEMRILTLASIINMPSLTSLSLCLRFEERASERAFRFNPSSLTSLDLSSMPGSMFVDLGLSLHQLQKLTLNMPKKCKDIPDYFEAVTSISSLTSLNLKGAWLSRSIGRLSKSH